MSTDSLAATTQTPRRTKQPTILAVDDKADLLESLSSLLMAYSYRVLTAQNGLEALDILSSHPVDVVLLDMKMPVLDGHGFMEELARQALDIPVVVVSGEASFDSVKRTLKAGAYDFIRKPYQAAELINTVDHALEHGNINQQNRAQQDNLKDSEFLHRFMINSSPDIIYMLDDRGYFTYINERVETLLNIPRHEVLGKHYSTILDNTSTHHTYRMNERRTDERRTQDIEIRFTRRAQDEKGITRNYYVPFELNAMGVYKTDRATQQKTLTGSYGIARDITARKQAESVIRFQAYHDILTGLPNRSLLKDRLRKALSQAQRSHEKVVFIFLDLDRFKTVNDTLGHSIGDQLLQSAARRLQSCIREGDTVSRYGGDEFALLLPRIRDVSDIEIIANKMTQTLNEVFHIAGNDIYISASMGIALYPDHGQDLETLIQHADIAMYHVKDSGKNGYQFFNDAVDGAYYRRLSLESQLRTAHDRNEIRIVYQPLVDAQTCELSGLEALLRWQHPEHGQLMPAEFLSIAEDTGFIIALGERVLRQVCQDLRRWKQSVPIAVNFSLTQVAHPDFLDMVFTTLQEYSIQPQQIELEITENAFVKDHLPIVDKLRVLSEAGIRITIDDFGTGYSSLSYLNQFPVHTLKMDGSFTQSLTTQQADHSIVDAIMAMARGLNLKLVAEGVETLAQYQYLADLGCDGMQGHLFSDALNTEAVETLLGQARPLLKH